MAPLSVTRRTVAGLPAIAGSTTRFTTFSYQLIGRFTYFTAAQADDTGRSRAASRSNGSLGAGNDSMARRETKDTANDARLAALALLKAAWTRDSAALGD